MGYINGTTSRELWAQVQTIVAHPRSALGHHSHEGAASARAAWVPPGHRPKNGWPLHFQNHETCLHPAPPETSPLYLISPKLWRGIRLLIRLMKNTFLSVSYPLIRQKEGKLYLEDTPSTGSGQAPTPPSKGLRPYSALCYSVGTRCKVVTAFRSTSSGDQAMGTPSPRRHKASISS